MIMPCMNSTSACDSGGSVPFVEEGSVLLGFPGAPGCTTTGPVAEPPPCCTRAAAKTKPLAEHASAKASPVNAHTQISNPHNAASPGATSDVRPDANQQSSHFRTYLDIFTLPTLKPIRRVPGFRFQRSAGVLAGSFDLLARLAKRVTLLGAVSWVRSILRPRRPRPAHLRPAIRPREAPSPFVPPPFLERDSVDVSRLSLKAVRHSLPTRKPHTPVSRLRNPREFLANPGRES